MVTGIIQRLPVTFTNPAMLPLAAPYIADDFNRANQVPIGTAGNGLTSADWEYITGATGSFGIVSNRARPTHVPGSTTSYLAFVNGGSVDGEVRGTLAVLGLSASTTDGSAIVGRLTDASNHVRLEASSTLGWRLRQNVAGTTTTLGTTSVMPAAGDVVTMRLAGSSATVTINGVSFTYSGVSTALTGTRWGIRLPRNGSEESAAFDTFRYYR